eukprot:3115878-Rhodomonas_salina.1
MSYSRDQQQRMHAAVQDQCITAYPCARAQRSARPHRSEIESWSARENERAHKGERERKGGREKGKDGGRPVGHGGRVRCSAGHAPCGHARTPDSPITINGLGQGTAHHAATRRGRPRSTHKRRTDIA